MAKNVVTRQKTNSGPIMQIEWNSTSTGDATTALVQGRLERRPVPATETKIQDRRSTTGGIRRQTGALSDETESVAARPAATTDGDLRRLKSPTANPWQDRIPADALFYTDVADLAEGIGQVGMLVSVRV